MKHWYCSLLLLALPAVSFAAITPPALGAASSFALFTAVGAFDNVGPSIVKGDIGTNAGAFSGFPLGVVTGDIHVADTYSTEAATDVQIAFGQLSAIPCVVPLGGLGGPPGNPQILIPNAYCLGGQTTFAGELILDAQGDANAVFFIRVNGAMTTGEGSTVTLINGASANNVYWQVTGRVDLGRNSVFQGTLVVDGAINLIEGASLIGRALSREGAITMDSNIVTLPGAPVAITSTNWLGSAVGTIIARRNWFLPSNWSNGVPTPTINATILGGRPSYPVIVANTAQARNLTLGMSASLTQNGGVLEIYRMFSNSGIHNSGGGTVVLAGDLNQNVGGTSISRFWNLTVGEAGAKLTGTAQLRRVLLLDGSLNTNNKLFTLISTATGTAMIVNSGGGVIGAATVQRYLTTEANSGLGYRQMSSPVQSTTVGDLTTVGFTPKVNSAYNVLPTPNLPLNQFPNVFGFNEARGGANNQNFIDGYFSPNTLEDELISGRGYSVYIKGGLTPDFVGTPSNGDRLMANLTSTGEGAKAGWHLLGNPYPSPLDWDLVPVPDGMSETVSVFKSTGSGQQGVYLTRAGGTGSLTNGEIAMAQGFFVRVTGPDPVSFNIPNAARVTTYSNPAHFRAAAETRPLIALTLHAVGAPTVATDAMTVYFQTGATEGLDRQFDGQKPAHNVGVPTLVSLTAQGAELAVNGLPATTLTTGATLPLLLDLPTAGTYELAVGQLLNLNNQAVTLLDRLTGTRYALQQQPSVKFTAERAGELRTRFVLEIGQRVTGQADLATALSVEVYPNPVKGTEPLTIALSGIEAGQQVGAVLYNQLGQAVWNQTLRATSGGVRQTVATALPRGLYTLRLTLPTGTTQTRHIVVN